MMLFCANALRSSFTVALIHTIVTLFLAFLLVLGVNIRRDAERTIKVLCLPSLRFEVIFVVQNRDQLIIRGRGGSEERRFLQKQKQKKGNVEMLHHSVLERERDESLIANLEGGFAEVDRRCSGAGGAGDDVGHLDRALQSDGTTKCWVSWEEER